MRFLRLRSLSNGLVHDVPFNDGMTVKDLCDVIFSLSDIPPERVRLISSRRRIVSGTDQDTSRTLDSCGVFAGVEYQFTDINDDYEYDDTDYDTDDSSVMHLEDVVLTLEQALIRTISPAKGHEPTDNFLKKVRHYWQDISLMDNQELKQKALKVIPVSDICREAQDRFGKEKKLLTEQHALTAALLRWFKRDFFKWTDSPDCWTCGKKTTKSHVEQPSQDESKYRASRTEVFKCDCGAITRFPRYNDPVKLLETRHGRCGEWARTFTLCAMAMDLRVRIVYDWTDHVWTEVWTGTSSRVGRWVHADSCEEALDEPLLYESGWGKKLTYCVAVGIDCVQDVTKRYSRQFDKVCERRTEALEGPLAFGLVRLDRQAVFSQPFFKRGGAHLRACCDVLDMASSGNNLISQLPGRQSGSKEWIMARGEDGSGSSK